MTGAENPPLATAVTPSQAKLQLIEKIESLIQQRLPADSAAALAGLASGYLAYVSPEDLAEQSAEDLYGAVLSHWNMGRQRPAGVSLIRAYNPDFDQHGWQSTHSIVEVATADRPFLVDSIVMELNRLGLRVHLVIHPVLSVLRDDDGTAIELDGGADSTAESFIHCEIDRQSERERLDEIKMSLAEVLEDVAAAASDFVQMREQLRTLAEQLPQANLPASVEDHQELVEFLHWVADDHFSTLR